MTAYNRPAVNVDLEKDVIGRAFHETHRAISSGAVDTVIEEGGRGSLKSSFCGVEIVLWILKWPQSHALVMRQMDNTLADSVVAQIEWAIGKLNLTESFQVKKSPYQIIYKPTGQNIYFRGLNDEGSIKGIKPPFGYIGVLWFEEADQLRKGEDAVLSVQQSAFRGTENNPTLTLISFNPPANRRNWANRYARDRAPRKLVHHSSYLEAPQAWLGTRFLADAEHLRKTKPLKYRHMYLGEMVGNGTQVFDNIKLETISRKKIQTFGETISGVDWGWYPDPWAWNRTAYDAARRTLYIFDELTRNKLNNFETAALLKKHMPAGEQLIADSAEPKSCADYRDQGLRCFEAVKGPGSLNQSMKWLQGLTAIVIDPERCPDTAKEFTEYEYETNKEGEAIQAYVDADNHHIDAVRYATNRIWLRKGA